MLNDRWNLLVRLWRGKTTTPAYISVIHQPITTLHFSCYFIASKSQQSVTAGIPLYWQEWNEVQQCIPFWNIQDLFSIIDKYLCSNRFALLLEYLATHTLFSRRWVLYTFPQQYIVKYWNSLADGQIRNVTDSPLFRRHIIQIKILKSKNSIHLNHHVTI